MNKSIAFCPGYVTGIFTIEKNNAAGAGFAIDKGMLTTVSESKKDAVFINGKKSNAPVSFEVIKRFKKIVGNFHVKVEHETELPIGYGFGMSAAGALSLSLALNDFLKCGLSKEQCLKIAHDCEVFCKTGLSGADAAFIGGFLIQKDIDSKPLKISIKKQIYFAFYSPIKTSLIISTSKWKTNINIEGKKALELLYKNPTWENFLYYSREFAIKSGLAKWCKKELEQNKFASMAMVGKTIFSGKMLKLIKRPKKIMKAKIYLKGAELIN
jgi:pantoate kinase